MKRKAKSRFPKDWKHEQTKERLKQMSVLVMDLMPQSVPCACCGFPAAEKTVFTLDNTDVFVIFYACLNCAMLSALQIIKDEQAKIEVVRPSEEQLEITIDAYAGARDSEDFVHVLKAQYQATQSENKSRKAGLN